MLFDSLGFAAFFPVVFAAYWSLSSRSYKAQNVLLLAASYFFYACWDERFLLLLIFSTLLDHTSGLLIHRTPSKVAKLRWLYLSVGVNLGILGVFKYYDFFAREFGELAERIGLGVDPVLLGLVLPIGISFYTFHGLSYVFDVYRGRIEPVRDVVDYGLFVSFFPLLVAGPIERAAHLLPQIRAPRTFRYERAVDGLRQCLWGFFKKLVIADNSAPLVDGIFADPAAQTGSTLLLGAVLFAVQIYGDFSGYSDIALGTARLLGFELLRNFAFPYFSRDIAEFWRRWHISLSSWFRDYLYIHLGGSRGSTWMKVRNTFIIFLVSGFWHGANWTFLVWGGLNAVYFLPSLLRGTNRMHLDTVAQGRLLPDLREVGRMLATFMLTCFAWIFFRSDDIPSAMAHVGGIFSASLFTWPQVPKVTPLALAALFMVVEWLGREQRFALERLATSWPRWGRWSLYVVIVFAIGFFMYPGEIPFIYFQF
ncbi:MAG: MBOAT family protein [Flavobacteriales bacterium]|nr:MBOAT family protein [Flavobacteriales bacterium]